MSGRRTIRILYLISQIEDKTNDKFYDTQKINSDGEILYSLVNKQNNIAAVKTTYPTRPYYSISEPFIFTGANTDAQFLSELKKEIESSDEIDFIVSFIKWSGIVRMFDDLKTFTDNGGKLRIVTTTYTGSTDAKAIEKLAELNNTEIKISYNTKFTRLHAKSYVFKTHEPLPQTCVHTPKLPINTSTFASIFLIGTKNFKITVSYCTYSHFFSIFKWSKPT